GASNAYGKQRIRFNAVEHSGNVVNRGHRLSLYCDDLVKRTKSEFGVLRGRVGNKHVISYLIEGEARIALHLEDGHRSKQSLPAINNQESKEDCSKPELNPLTCVDTHGGKSTIARSNN